MTMSNTLIAPRLEKAQGWTRQYTIDFSQFQEIQSGGQSITAATFAAEDTDGGLTLTPSNGTGSITGSQVSILLSSGTVGYVYLLKCTITTSGGATLIGWGALEIVPDPAP